MASGPETRARKVINGYGDGGFRIAGERVEGSIIVFPERFLAWPVGTAAEIDAASLHAVVEAARHIDILLLGLGPTGLLPDRALLAYLKEQRIAVDVMDTGAACRTYNILLTESRAIAAALVAV